MAMNNAASRQAVSIKSKNKDHVQSMFLSAFNLKWQKLTHLSNNLFSSSRNHSNFSLSYPKNSCQPGGQS